MATNTDLPDAGTSEALDLMDELIARQTTRLLVQRNRLTRLISGLRRDRRLIKRLKALGNTASDEDIQELEELAVRVQEELLLRGRAIRASAPTVPAPTTPPATSKPKKRKKQRVAGKGNKGGTAAPPGGPPQPPTPPGDDGKTKLMGVSNLAYSIIRGNLRSGVTPGETLADGLEQVYGEGWVDQPLHKNGPFYQQDIAMGHNSDIRRRLREAHANLVRVQRHHQEGGDLATVANHQLIRLYEAVAPENVLNRVEETLRRWEVI